MRHAYAPTDLQDSILHRGVAQAWPCVLAFVSYVLILYSLARVSIWFSTLLILLTPALLLLFVSAKRVESRVIQLVSIGYIFMISVTIGLIGTVAGFSALQAVAFVGFCLYFSIQAIGFVIDCLKKRELMGVICTLFGISTIFSWIFLVADRRLAISDDNMMMVFGSPAPWWVIAVYFFWFCVVITSSRVLPSLAEFLVHAISVAVSAFSGAFFFMRLLTASNLFLLDIFLNYSRGDFLGSRQLRFSDAFYDHRWIGLKWRIHATATAGNFLAMLAGMNAIFNTA